VIADGREDEVKRAIAGLVVVDDESGKPTDEQRARLSEWSNSDVSTGDDWYSVLRECQGDPEQTIASGHILDGLSFANDSLFCEWGYVIDFDARQFEIYKGFQTEAHSKGRFVADGEPGYISASAEYYPISLVTSVFFDDIPQVISVEDSEDDEDNPDDRYYLVVTWSDGNALRVLL